MHSRPAAASSSHHALRPIRRGCRRGPHDVRLDRREVDRYARAIGQRCRQRARPRVILGQALDVVVERVEAGGGEHAGLAHAAAEQLAQPARAGDRLGRGDDDRPDRRAQALGEAERHAVGAGARLGQRCSRARPRRWPAARRPCARAARARGRARSRAPAPRGSHTRPPETACVFSMQSSRATGRWMSLASIGTASSSSSTSSAEPVLCSPRGWAPQSAATPPASSSSRCESRCE